MLALSELAFIIKKNKLTKPELLDLSEGRNSKSNIFFESMLNESFKNDDEASSALYEVEKNHTTYRKFKKEFKKKLINHLFFLNFDSPSFTERQKAYYTCYKDWAAVKILLAKGGWKPAVDICFKILKKARHFEFTDLAFDVTKTLKIYYAIRVRNLKKYEYYGIQYNQFKKTRDYENFAEELYTDLVVRYAKSKSKEEEVYQNAVKCYNSLKDTIAICDSYWVQLCGFLIELTIHSSKSDYENIIVVCERAITFFKKKKYSANVALQIFYYQKIICQTQLKQYELGRETAKKGLKLVETGSSNWFLYQEWYFILSMHTQNYLQAFRVFEIAVSHKQFSFQPEQTTEFWSIYEAYLYFLFLIGKLSGVRVRLRLSEFKHGKFNNNTPIYSKDKRGMNIPILIAQTLLLIAHQKYGKALLKIDAIQKYSTRHLRQNDVFRSNCFIKMIGQIPHCGFHKVALERKTRYYLKQLKNTPLEVANQSHEIEIIPYERLWDITVDLMRERRYEPRVKNNKIDKITT